MADLTVRLVPGLSQWAYGDRYVPAGEDCTVPDDDGAVSAAVAAGVLELLEGEPTPVESEEDSLAKYELAQGAKADLYAERDAEIYEASDVADVDRIMSVYEERMAEAAQEALEADA